MSNYVRLPLQIATASVVNRKNDSSSKAIELALKATEEDRKKNYDKAIELYKNCNEILRHILTSKNLSNANTAVLLKKHEEYDERVKKISSYLDLKKSEEKNGPTDFDENKNKIKLECKICLEQLRVTESPIWILDCGHLSFCDGCSHRILNEGNNSKCPICRIEITDRKRAYFCG